MASSRNKPLTDTDLLHTLATRLSLEVQPTDPIAVALSGGRDSIVLADLLARLLPPERLHLVHVHHGLSPNADTWADFCASFAHARGLRIDIHRVQVGKALGKGLEAAARDARWAVLVQYPSHVLALGHHQDDQAETVLFRLLRGTGVQGLAGMARVCHRRGQTIWRPLLDYPKQVLANYADQQGLSWVEDESNRDTHYSRNYLRCAVLPVLHQRFPSATTAISRLAGHAAEASELLDERAQEDLAALLSAGEVDVIELSVFQKMSTARQRNVLRYWLRQAGWHPPETHTLDAWLVQINSAKPGQRICLAYSQGRCTVHRGRIYRQFLSSSI